MRSNVLLCRAIVRIGEVFSKKTEGFGKNQRHHFAKFAEKPLCVCGATPSARKLATSPIASQTEEDIATFPAFNYDAQFIA